MMNGYEFAGFPKLQSLKLGSEAFCYCHLVELKSSGWNGW